MPAMMKISADVIAMAMGLPEGTVIEPAATNDGHTVNVMVSHTDIPAEAIEVTGRFARVNGERQFMGYELVESRPPAYA